MTEAACRRSAPDLAEALGRTMDIRKILIFTQKKAQLDKILSLKSGLGEVNNLDVCLSTPLR
ncbi:hypothetical protein, partial [uncultured Paracoccus sp.]|uniref:hypothetical protein n=1 Tax=uncultured Paracoccus sp. TaxID=189685 RepID=UPI0025D4CFA6